MVKLFSNSLFMHHNKLKMIFGLTTLVDSDQKCKFTDFVRSTATAIMWLQNSILLQVIRCIQLVQRQNMETSTCLCVVLSYVICL